MKGLIRDAIGFGLFTGVCLLLLNMPAWAGGDYGEPADIEPLVIENSPGGQLRAFAARYNKALAERRPVEIRGDFAKSAATLWLSYPWVCTEPGTMLKFHGPSNGLVAVVQMQVVPYQLHHYMSEEQRAEVTNQMIQHYALHGNIRIAQWFARSGAAELFGQNYKTVSGAEAHRAWGKDLCPPPYTASKTVTDRELKRIGLPPTN